MHFDLYTTKAYTRWTHTPQKSEPTAKNRRRKRIPMYNICKQSSRSRNVCWQFFRWRRISIVYKYSYTNGFSEIPPRGAAVLYCILRICRQCFSASEHRPVYFTSRKATTLLGGAYVR